MRVGKCITRFFKLLGLYLHTYIHTHTYIITYIHTYIHTYKQTYIYTYIHTYIHTYIQHNYIHNAHLPKSMPAHHSFHSHHAPTDGRGCGQDRIPTNACVAARHRSVPALAIVRHNRPTAANGKTRSLRPTNTAATCFRACRLCVCARGRVDPAADGSALALRRHLIGPSANHHERAFHSTVTSGKLVWQHLRQAQYLRVGCAASLAAGVHTEVLSLTRLEEVPRLFFNAVAAISMLLPTSGLY